MSDTTNDPPVRLRLGHNEELVVNNRYETMSIVNDVLVAVFFVSGSILFYFDSLMPVATTLFLLGSVDLLLRPVIRLARRTHLQRLGQQDDGSGEY